MCEKSPAPFHHTDTDTKTIHEQETSSFFCQDFEMSLNNVCLGGGA